MYFMNDRMDRCLRYGFFLFLFLLPFQTVYFLRETFVSEVKWEYGMVGVYFVDILLLIFIISLLTEAFFFKKYQISNFKYPISTWMLVMFLLWSGLSIFWAGDLVLAFSFFVKLILAVGLFFAVRLIEIDMKKIVFVLLVAGVLQSGIGVAQFLYQYSPASSILGMSAHDASVAGSSVLKIASGRFLRAYGTFPHPNILGGFLGVILVLCISYYVSAIKEKESYKLQVTSYKKNEIPSLEDSVGMTIEGLMLTGGSIIILLGLLLTFSRTAWLGALLGLVAIGFSAFKQKDYWIRRRFLKTLFALVLAGIAFGSVLHEQIFPRFDTKAIEREGSVSERMVSLQDARTLIKKHPLIGVGAGNFTAAIIEKGEMGIMGERGGMGSHPVWSIQPVHNVFILIWSELGLIGIVLFVLFLFFILKSSITNHNSAILIAIFPSLFLDHFLWSSHFGLLFFFLLLGLASRKPLTE